MFGRGRPASMPVLIQRARRDGHRAGRSGKYDEWSIAEPDGLPYVRSLDHQRDHDLAQIDVAELTAEERRLRRRVDAQVEAATAREDIEIARDELADVRRYLDACNTQMDRIAMREARIQEESRGRRKADRDDPPPPAHMPPDYPYQSGPDEGVSWPRAQWVGPHARRMSERTKLLALLTIALVEAPLQWRIFHYFEPQFWLSVIFTLPVAAIMVVLPHFVGLWYRERTATGADPLQRWLPPALLMPWALLAFFLGDLRRRVLLAPIRDARGNTFPSLAGNLGLSPYTVSAMFIALLLLTGGIAFMLGIAGDHPIVAAYRAAAERRERILERVRGDRTALTGAQQRLDGFADERDNAGERAARRRTAVVAGYAAAASTYLDAVADELADPAATEAAGRTGGRHEAPSAA